MSLTKHRMTVTLQGKDEPLEIESANPDLVRFDLTAAKHKWPPMTDAPMLWSTFVAWAACTRLGLYTDTWDKFSKEDCLDVDMDQDAGDPADPSQTGPGPSSA